MPPKKVLLIEREPSRAECLRLEIRKLAAGRVELTIAASLGAASLALKETRPELVVFDLAIPVSSDAKLETVDGLQFLWYLSRRFTGVASLVLLESSSDQADSCLEAGASLIASRPGVNLDYRDVALKICQFLAVLLTPKVDPNAWWEKPEWVLTAAAGEVLAARDCRDLERRTDLIDFFSIKARQLQTCLKTTCWSGVTLTSDRPSQASLQVLALSQGRHVLTFKSDNQVNSSPLDPSLLQILSDLGIVQDSGDDPE